MRKLSQQEIKKYELDMLLELKRVCDENNITFYLAYGTLLGAIRHGGFIPWDDDIDIIMSRPNYNKLIELNRKYALFNKPYKMICGEDDTLYLPYMKIVNTSTNVVEKYLNNKADQSLWVDVFPIDGISKDGNEIERILKKGNFYRRLLFWNYVRLDYKDTSLLRRVAKVFAFMCARCVGAKRCRQKIFKLAAKTPYESAEYVLNVAAGEPRSRTVHGQAIPKSEFEKSTKVSFEGYSFDAINNYDAYLKFYYGDYMTLPPKEKQIGHNMDVFELDSKKNDA